MAAWTLIQVRETGDITALIVYFIRRQLAEILSINCALNSLCFLHGLILFGTVMQWPGSVWVTTTMARIVVDLVF